MAYAIFELEPIGVNGAMEAVAEHIFCSALCANVSAAYWADNSLNYSNPQPTEPTMDGLICESCGKVVS